jgi:hypothetical protein
MNASRIRVGLAVTLFGIGLSAGTASAVEGCSFSDCRPQSNESDVLPNSDVLPAEETRELPFTAEEEPASGSLPLTGGDIAGMVVLGGAAIGTGTVLVRRSRTRTAA